MPYHREWITAMRYTPKPKTKLMPCRHCGEDIEVGWKTKKKPAHAECSIRKAAEVQRQMHYKSGPYYDKWVEAMRIASGNLPRTPRGGCDNTDQG